jgi:hypothetical protein
LYRAEPLILQIPPMKASQLAAPETYHKSRTSINQ